MNSVSVVAAVFHGVMLADGTYDVFVVDAHADGETMHFDMTVTAGPHKGEVIAIQATGLDRDEIDLIGMPATLTVTAGRPAVSFDV